MPPIFRILSLLLLLLSFSPFIRAEGDTPKPAGFRTSLFNGKDLAGWHVTGCKAAVEDGNLVILEGDGFVRTDHRYTDFVLELDWKARRTEKYDSGIYFRSELPEAGKPWPKQYQINLKQGDEGNCIGVKEARSTGLIKAGDWNHFK